MKFQVQQSEKACFGDFCKIGMASNAQAFPLYDPLTVFLTQTEKQQIVCVLDELRCLAGLNYLPPILRMDFLFSEEGNLKLLEVNTDVPAGYFFLIQALRCFGQHEEADRVREILIQLFGKKPLFLIESTSVAAIWEMEIAKKEGFEVSILDPKNSSKIDQFEKIVRTSPWENHLGTHVDTSRWINPVTSYKMASKTLLSQLDSPIILKSQHVTVDKEGITVPDGIVAKTPLDYGGKGIYFSGDELPLGDYLYQEFFPLYRSGNRCLGFDLFVVNGGEDFFAFARSCGFNQKLLNLCSGGGFHPVVLG